MDDKKMTEQTSESVSRRGFIKGVIAAGAVASSSAYLFRTTPLLGQPSAPGAVERLITLNVNGQDRRVDVMKQETLAMTPCCTALSLPVAGSASPSIVWTFLPRVVCVSTEHE